MSLRSSLYVGSVMHRRHHPRAHRFRYRAFWLLVDLDELPELSRRLRVLSHNRANLFALHDADHGDGSTTPLRLQVQRELAGAGIDLVGGAIRLLCMPRTFGCGFNPLSVYFCSHADGTLAAVLYQVHNTFGERHSYLIPARPNGGALRQRCDKSFYVSPFIDMDLRYEFRVSGPDERIAIGIKGLSSGGPVISAALVGERRALTDRALLGLCASMPAVTLKVVAAIHWEALRLWLKGLRLRRRPDPPGRPVSVASTGFTVTD